VQQALALGRKRLDQNSAYQHTTIEEVTSKHQEFLAFSSFEERIDFLHKGIRSGAIKGPVTTAYHELLRNNDPIKADAFLNVHATAMHVTPFGACTHDFAQAPCPKHLQCWNACSNLHLTGSEREREMLALQVKSLSESIEIMRITGVGEAGADVWLADQESKLQNLKNVLAQDSIQSIQVFPDGQPKTVSQHTKRKSAVADDADEVSI